MKFGIIWKRSNLISKILAILIVLYVPVSVYVQMWGFGLLKNMLAMDDDMMWICYAIVSFGLVILIAVYHLATIFFRRKRKTDKILDMKRSVTT